MGMFYAMDSCSVVDLSQVRHPKTLAADSTRAQLCVCAVGKIDPGADKVCNTCARLLVVGGNCLRGIKSTHCL